MTLLLKIPYIYKWFAATKYMVIFYCVFNLLLSCNIVVFLVYLKTISLPRNTHLHYFLGPNKQIICNEIIQDFYGEKKKGRKQMDHCMTKKQKNQRVKVQCKLSFHMYSRLAKFYIDFSLFFFSLNPLCLPRYMDGFCHNIS